MIDARVVREPVRMEESIMAQPSYAGRSQDERVEARKPGKAKALEQPGGGMAVEGTQADTARSSGELSEVGKEVWRKGSGMDGGGRSG